MKEAKKQDLNIQEFDYELPSDRIAKYPADKRENSKLLVYQNKKMVDCYFYQINDYLPKDSILLLNNTKVIQSRLIFHKETGAEIEIFCLKPYGRNSSFETALQAKEKSVWKCLIGNAKKWKKDSLEKEILTENGVCLLKANRLASDVVEFSWENKNVYFSDILNKAGFTPLPPYIKRKAEKKDKNRYQTVYSHHNGSVAAPTAGLHFTKDKLEQLKQNGIDIQYLTLHVGAGTFVPVKEAEIQKHVMHTEQISISKDTINYLYRHADKKMIAVGTTTIRTLESLYCFAAKLYDNPDATFSIGQWDAYEMTVNLSKKKAMELVLKNMESNRIEFLAGETKMMIVPGYRYKMTDTMITNFHQPKSTLLLLISAYLGDEWKRIYEHALQHNYRFLSYGDVCFFDC